MWTTMDIAPYADVRTWDAPRDIGLRWEEPRAIQGVELVFTEDADIPDPSSVRLEYWANHWPSQRPEGRDTGGMGWMPNDDWWNGRWQPADTDVEVEGRTMNFRFRPLAEVEVPEATDYSVTFRVAMQLRLVFDGPVPPLERLSAYSLSRWRDVQLVVRWGCGAPPLAEVPTVEAYNGALVDVTPLADGNGMRLAVRCADCGEGESPDRTIVTLRTADGGVSFRPDEVVGGEPTFVQRYGILITDAAADVPWEEFRARLAGRPKTVYERVFDQAEQSLSAAIAAMPDPQPLYFAVGCAGARQKFRLDPDGNIALPRNFIDQVPGRDTGRMLWDGTLVYRFGVPDQIPRRRLQDGYLPILHSLWRDGDVSIEATALATPLEQSILAGRLEGDDTICLLQRFEVTNHGAERVTFGLPIETHTDSGQEMLVQDDDGFAAETERGRRFRFLAEAAGGDVGLVDGRAFFSATLEPGARSHLTLKVPFVTISFEREFAALRAKGFDREREEVAAYWASRVADGCEIRTPERNLNDFHKAHLTHMLITDDRIPGSDCIATRVGSFHYGNFSNESCMIISDLDRRGYTEEARLRLETFLRYQGTVGLPGNFRSQDGIFYGSGGYEHGDYNQHHGWVLWCMGEHYRYTRDEDWLAHAAPGILKGCDWVIREREATKRFDEQGHRVLEYGFLPAGSLEDVRDYYYWLSTNCFTYRGLKSCADALADAGHPEAERLQREAEAYRQDLLRGFTEQAIRCPVVRLRNGTAVQHFPSRLYLRGRDLGWIRETLEGAIHLVACEVLDPLGPEATDIIQDYEDNLYIGGTYGYALEDFERDWFSLGGFSMQPNLLWGPVPYLRRDEVKHYLRAYFNSFASAYRPDVQMLTEHPLPRLGACAGDHFKTSDEAQSTNWLRMMFLREQGNDLYVGQGIPRAWMEDGNEVGIARAVTWFGETSFSIVPEPSDGRITMTLRPPRRNPPARMFVRLRHPDGLAAQRALINGVPSVTLDREKEWVVLGPSVDEELIIVAEYPARS